MAQFNWPLTALTIFMVSGCATTYDTEKSHWTGDRGFSQQQLEHDVWQIDFTGNAHTDTETREKYLLKKAAQITINGNYSFFKVIQSKSEKDIKENESSGGNASIYGRGRSNKRPINTDTSTTMTVKLLKEKEGGNGDIYEAGILVNSTSE